VIKSLAESDLNELYLKTLGVPFVKTNAYATQNATAPLVPFNFQSNDPRQHDNDVKYRFVIDLASLQQTA
jgi:hypothetical protein